MIILVFHVVYLLGKFVYERYQGSKHNPEVAMSQKQKITKSRSPYVDIDDYEDSDKPVIKFFPPLYLQRYVRVQDVLCQPQYRGKIRKVVDFGCAELGFAVHLKHTDSVQEIFLVDVDRSLLEKYHDKIAPLTCDYISGRSEPLSVYVCEGSVIHNDDRLANMDAVICIELIEHLYPDCLDAFPKNIFGFIKPLLAVVTTPNAEFNVLFNDFAGFRHHDHKFEWTREEFQNWANSITRRYHDYEVTFEGIGAGPPGTEHLGCCSQMAIFHRKSQLQGKQSNGVNGLLRTIATYEYPHRVDNRSDEKKILDDAVYYIRLYSARHEEFSEDVPLEELTLPVNKYNISIEELRLILEEANWVIEDRDRGPVVLIPPESTTFSVSPDLDYEEFLDNDYGIAENPEWEALEPGPPDGRELTISANENISSPYEEENWDEDS